MRKFQFNKLVRNAIIEHQLKAGQIPHYHRLTGDEYRKALIQKVIEEVGEITRAKPQDVAEEIADVQQALDELKASYQLSANTIHEAQARKNQKNGSFDKGVFIEYLELDEKDEWVKYYTDQPDRFPELP